VRQWCSQRQISEPSFYSWRRTLSERDAPVERKQPVRRKSRCKRALRAMIPVEIVPPSSQQQLAPLEITLGGGIHLLVRGHCQSALLREALTALRPEPEEPASC
jgi:hypothetical protein